MMPDSGCVRCNLLAAVVRFGSHDQLPAVLQAACCTAELKEAGLYVGQLSLYAWQRLRTLQPCLRLAP